MTQKLILLGAVAFMALTLNGCAYQRGYWRGKASGNYQYGWHDGYKQARGRGLEDKVRDLEMENAALKAANKHLLELEHGK